MSRARSVAAATIVAAVALTIALAPAAPRHAAAQQPDRRRVAVVLLDGTDISGWVRDPALEQLVRAGANALLSTRTGSDETSDETQRASAYASLGSGTRAGPGDPGDALAGRLRSAGISAGIDGSDLAARILGLDALPHASPAVAEPVRDVTIFEPATGEGTPLVARLRSVLRPRDTLIVASLRAPAERRDARVFLGAFTATGFGWRHGLVRSASTRRDGVVTIADVAPTILISAGVNPDPSMDGRPAENAESETPIATLLDMDAAYDHAARVRRPLLRGFAWIAMAALALSALALVSRRAAFLPAAGLALTVVAAAPLAIFLEPIRPGTSVAEGVAWPSAVAVALGVGAFAVLRSSRAIAVLCGVTAVVVLADLALGGPIASRSPLSYLLAEGSRFYGIGNELMGVVVGCTLVAVAFAYDRVDAFALPGALLMTTAVALMAAPSIGAKFGSVFVALPAFGMVAARAGGRKPSWRLAGALEAVAAAATAIVFFADRLQPLSKRSHIGSVGGAGSGATLARKAAAALRLVAFSIWMVTLLVCAGAGAYVVARRRDDVRIMLNLRRHLSAALLGGGLAVVGALVFNDAGTIAAAFIAIFLVVSSFAALVTIDSARKELSG